jgi:lysophospholipase L1-like esterase
VKSTRRLSIGVLSAIALTVTISSARAQADDARPVVDALTVPVETAANKALPTLHLVGDSTLRPSSTDGKVGWAERIQPYFDTGKINIVDDAIAGRSARTFFTEGRWQRVLDTLKPGDFVIIQFGTNDRGQIGDPANKHRADGHGIGNETVEDMMPNGTKEQVHTFGWYMADYVTTGQAKVATVILVSPIPHKQHWENDRDFADIAQWDSEVAKAHHAPYFDLTMVIIAAYKKEGAEKVAAYFADKGTHTTDAGAQLNAACVIAGLKSLANNPLEKFFSEKAKDIAPFVPASTAETSKP